MNAEDARFCHSCGNLLSTSPGASDDELEMDSPTMLSPNPGEVGSSAATGAGSGAGAGDYGGDPAASDGARQHSESEMSDRTELSEDSPERGSDRRPRSGSGLGATSLPLGVSASDPGGRFSFGDILAGRYRILGPVGSGGMGDVYRADDLKLGQPVALKFLPHELSQDRDRLGRLFAEVRLARQVAHRNVCRVYDIVEEGGVHFIAMEFVDGEDLGTLLRRVGRFSTDKATEIARQLCAGLHAAHEQGILHRDLKPANILIDGRGVAHIADFGLAALDDQIDEREIRAGTPTFMAPEQIEGREVTARSDIYSLGLVFHEMYTGRRALTGRTLAEVRDQQSVLSSRISSDLSDLDPAVDRVLRRCLDPDPEMRPASALALAAALPGGDPLADALAAGEVPSPAMVAASGSVGVLPMPWGLASLAVILLSLLFTAFLAEETSLYGKSGMEKPAAVLKERASELARSFGYPDSAVADRVQGWYQDAAAIRYEKDVRPEAPAWDSLHLGQPSAVYFWYRESPSPLVATNLVGHVGATNPPVDKPGMTLLSLNPQGDLSWFQGVARPDFEREATNSAADSTSGFDWYSVMEAAALDPEAFQEMEADWVPPRHADHIKTWRGHYPDRPDREIEVRMSSFHDQLTWFEIRQPWELDDRASASGGGGQNRIGSIVNFMIVFLIVSASLLARSHFKAGLGDLQGAARLGAVLVFLMFFSLVAEAHHVPLFGPEWTMFQASTGLSLFLGGLFWVLYVALEPFARRLWPEVLISWSRLLRGRIRDPRVGREILLGLAAGSILATWDTIWLDVTRRMGAPMPTLRTFSSGMIEGLPSYVTECVNLLVNAIWVPMAIFLLVIGFRTVLRHRLISILVTSTLVAAVFFFGTESAMGKASALVSVALAAVLLFRVGLLSFMAFYFAATVPARAPLTLNFDHWYAWSTTLTALLMVGLAVFAFRNCRESSGTAPSTPR